MVNGEYQEFTHTLENLRSDVAYQINFTLNDTWFNDPGAEEYGLTYGVKNSGGDPIIDIIVDPLATETINFWFETHEDIMSGNVITNITLNGIKAGNPLFGGDFGFRASGRSGGEEPIFKSHQCLR